MIELNTLHLHEAFYRVYNVTRMQVI